MSSEINNKYKIQGTIYNKEFEEIKGRKDPTQTYRKYIITLEVTSSEERNTKDGSKYSTKSEFPQFEAFNPVFDVDSFVIGEYVEIWFYLSGKKFTYKNGERAGKEGIITRCPITYIKYADLDNNDRPVKPPVEPNVARETVFVAPNPNEDDKKEDDDLPFIFTIPLALGFLSQFLI